MADENMKFTAPSLDNFDVEGMSEELHAELHHAGLSVAKKIIELTENTKKIALTALAIKYQVPREVVEGYINHGLEHCLEDTLIEMSVDQLVDEIQKDG